MSLKKTIKTEKEAHAVFYIFVIIFVEKQKYLLLHNLNHYNNNNNNNNNISLIMKSESLVIADQNAAVNTFPGLVHTARHTMGVGCKRSS